MKCIGKSWSVWPYQKVNSFKWLPFGYKTKHKDHEYKSLYISVLLQYDNP